MAKDQNDLREMTAADWQRLSNEDKLAIIEFALIKLDAGSNRIQVRHQDYWTSYGIGNAPQLRLEVQRLRMIVGGRRPITINPPGPPVVGIYPPRNSTGWPPRY